MRQFPLKDPQPDFEALKRALLGEEQPERVHIIDVADAEVIKDLAEHVMEEDFPSMDESLFSGGSDSHRLKKLTGFLAGNGFKLIDGELDEVRIRRDIAFYYRMGLDIVPDFAPGLYMGSMIAALATEEGLAGGGARRAADTAQERLSRGQRNWQEEKTGIIRSWEDFERIPWDRVDLDVLEMDDYYRYFEEQLPDGMAVTAISGIFEPGLVGALFGFEDLCCFLYEQPDLVRAVAEKWGQLNLELYERMISAKCVGVLWHVDDMAYSKQTMISVDHLRELILPWLKKYADLAHDRDKMVWLHCCGNIYPLMEDLIERVGFDAKHSFEDSVMPVTQHMETYGRRIAGLGGVDMDKLCRLPVDELRDYCRSILDACMPYGRFAYGSGNSIANYVPTRNVLAMLEEGYNYR
jgi:uroporphyrinogen decarboxylase